MASALKLTLPIAAGSAFTDSIGPPAEGAPRNGSSWIRMMMPMPDMNPEMTACGVYAT